MARAATLQSVYGFLGADHYYASQSSAVLLPAIRTPTLLLVAEDDPLLHPSVLPRAVAAGLTRAALTAQRPPNRQDRTLFRRPLRGHRRSVDRLSSEGAFSSAPLARMRRRQSAAL